MLHIRGWTRRIGKKMTTQNVACLSLGQFVVPANRAFGSSVSEALLINETGKMVWSGTVQLENEKIFYLNFYFFVFIGVKQKK